MEEKDIKGDVAVKVRILLLTKFREEIKSLVDQIFKEFSTPEDNMIALWAINNGLKWNEDEEKKSLSSMSS